MSTTPSTAQDNKRALAIVKFTNLIKEACEELDVDVDGKTDVETRKLFAEVEPETFIALRTKAGLKLVNGEVIAA